MNSEEQKSNYPETDKFLAWYKEQQKKGLQDVKFCTLKTDTATVESVLAEVNTAINAETVKPPESL